MVCGAGRDARLHHPWRDSDFIFGTQAGSNRPALVWKSLHGDSDDRTRLGDAPRRVNLPGLCLHGCCGFHRLVERDLHSAGLPNSNGSERCLRKNRNPLGLRFDWMGINWQLSDGGEANRACREIRGSWRMALGRKLQCYQL